MNVELHQKGIGMFSKSSYNRLWRIITLPSNKACTFVGRKCFQDAPEALETLLLLCLSLSANKVTHVTTVL